MNWPENPPAPPSSNFSWETSSAVSEATTESLASGLEDLEAQQTKMTDATTKLLSVVSEAGGGPWSDSPGVTEDLLSEWLGVQEDWGDGLRDMVIRKQEELAMMEEMGEENFRNPGQTTGQSPLYFNPSGRFSQGQGTRVQASRDQDQQTPGQGRGGDGNRPPGSLEAPTQARPLGSGERGRRDQPPPG